MTKTEQELLEALEHLLFSAVADEHGVSIAAALANDWSQWPDNTPNMVRPVHENARAAIAKLRNREIARS